MDKMALMIETDKLNLEAALSTSASTFIPETKRHRRISDATVRQKLHQVIFQLILAAECTNIKSFRPAIVAFELCRLEQSLFIKITTLDVVNHHRDVSAAVTDAKNFFNYLSSIIQFSVLEPLDAASRAAVIEQWLHIAKYSEKFNNMSTLMNIITSLTTPPVKRLRNTWPLVNKKSLTWFKEMEEICSPESNFAKWRQFEEKRLRKPGVPYIGVKLYDATYLLAGKAQGADSGHKTSHLDEAVANIDAELKFFRNGGTFEYSQLSEHLKLSKSSPKKRKSAFFTREAAPELEPLRTVDIETVGTFVQHYLLSRKAFRESDLDQLSVAREPKAPGSPTTPRKIKELFSSTDLLSLDTPQFNGTGYDYLSANNIAIPPELFGGNNAAAILAELQVETEDRKRSAILKDTLKRMAGCFPLFKRASTDELSKGEHEPSDNERRESTSSEGSSKSGHSENADQYGSSQSLFATRLMERDSNSSLDSPPSSPEPEKAMITVQTAGASFVIPATPQSHTRSATTQPVGISVSAWCKFRANPPSKQQLQPRGPAPAPPGHRRTASVPAQSNPMLIEESTVWGMSGLSLLGGAQKEGRGERS